LEQIQAKLLLIRVHHVTTTSK